MSAATIALRGLVRKELRQVRTDPRMLQVLVMAPLVQLFIFAYAANLDVATTRVALLDRDRSPESRSLAARVAASDRFELVGSAEDEHEANAMLDRGAAELVFAIPQGYGKALSSEDQSTRVQILVDGSNSVPASVGLAEATGLLGAISREARPPPPSIAARTRVLFNPELRSRIFLVPGILGTVLMMVTLVATAMAIVREREVGTFEQLVVTPAPRWVLVAGKLVPFALFGALDALLILAVAHLWFRVPLEGSVALLLASVVPYLMCTLGLGLFVSTVSRTQQQAMMTSMFFVMLPMIYLSGFVFPIESMPRPIQPLTEIIPLRHFLVIVRGVMLKGAGVAELRRPLIALVGLGIGIFGLSVAVFRKRTD